MMVMICARAVPRERAIWVLQRFSAPMHAAPLPAAHYLRVDRSQQIFLPTALRSRSAKKLRRSLRSRACAIIEFDRQPRSFTNVELAASHITPKPVLTS
jgi:hypothetical protein